MSSESPEQSACSELDSRPGLRRCKSAQENDRDSPVEAAIDATEDEDAGFCIAPQRTTDGDSKDPRTRVEQAQTRSPYFMEPRQALHYSLQQTAARIMPAITPQLSFFYRQEKATYRLKKQRVAHEKHKNAPWQVADPLGEHTLQVSSLLKCLNPTQTHTIQET